MTVPGARSAVGSTTAVRRWSRGSDDPTTAASNVVADPGELTLTVRGERRTLRVGTDVVSVRYDEGRGKAGRVAFLGVDGQRVMVLEVSEWMPGLTSFSQYCHGDLTEPVDWTGARELTAAAELPLECGRVRAPVTVSPKQAGRPAFVVAATIGLSLCGVVWIIALALNGVLDSRPVWSTALVAMAAFSIVLFAEQQVRWALARRQPPGEALRPHPDVPVARSFRREARLVLSPAAPGPVDTLIVRYPDRRQERMDGPASPLGVQRAVVVTPTGATRPERVEFLDGLGRQLLRLRWDQWFGAGEQELERLTTRGIPVERVTGTAMAGPRDSLLVPRSLPGPLIPFDLPGAFPLERMAPLTFGASLAPLVFGARLGDSLMVTVGILNGLLLVGPTLFRLVGLLLDRPRPPR